LRAKGKGQGFKYVSLLHIFEAAGTNKWGKVKLTITEYIAFFFLFIENQEQGKRVRAFLSTRNKADCNKYF